jgi:hypothetical protein
MLDLFLLESATETLQSSPQRRFIETTMTFAERILLTESVSLVRFDAMHYDCRYVSVFRAQGIGFLSD